MFLSLLVLQAAAWGLDWWGRVLQVNFAKNPGASPLIYLILQYFVMALIFIVLVVFVVRLRFTTKLSGWARMALVGVTVVWILTMFPITSLGYIFWWGGTTRFFPLACMLWGVLGVWRN